jgi:hypothetical protein
VRPDGFDDSTACSGSMSMSISMSMSSSSRRTARVSSGSGLQASIFGLHPSFFASVPFCRACFVLHYRISGFPRTGSGSVRLWDLSRRARPAWSAIAWLAGLVCPSDLGALCRASRRLASINSGEIDSLIGEPRMLVLGREVLEVLSIIGGWWQARTQDGLGGQGTISPSASHPVYVQ